MPPLSTPPPSPDRLRSSATERSSDAPERSWTPLKLELLREQAAAKRRHSPKRIAAPLCRELLRSRRIHCIRKDANSLHAGDARHRVAGAAETACLAVVGRKRIGGIDQQRHQV